MTVCLTPHVTSALRTYPLALHFGTFNSAFMIAEYKNQHLGKYLTTVPLWASLFGSYILVNKIGLKIKFYPWQYRNDFIVVDIISHYAMFCKVETHMCNIVYTVLKKRCCLRNTQFSASFCTKINIYCMIYTVNRILLT